jgi:hypothetical protein
VGEPDAATTATDFRACRGAPDRCAVCPPHAGEATRQRITPSQPARLNRAPAAIASRGKASHQACASVSARRIASANPARSASSAASSSTASPSPAAISTLPIPVRAISNTLASSVS